MLKAVMGPDLRTDKRFAAIVPVTTLPVTLSVLIFFFKGSHDQG